MNKLLIITFTLCSILVTSCYKRTSTETKEEKVQKVEEVAAVPKTRYKADIRKELAPDFTHKKSGNVEQVMPKHIGNSGEGIYSYFFIRNDRGISLKLHIQYSKYNADLFEIDADGETMEYEANKTHVSEGNFQVVEGAVFQWYDKGINLSDEEFFNTMANAKNVTLTMKVQKGNKVLGSIALTKDEVQSLVNTIEYYKSCNGAKIPKKGMVNIRG